MRLIFSLMLGAGLFVAAPAMDASAHDMKKCVAKKRDGSKVKFYCKASETCRFSTLLNRSYCRR
jgi:hypothetical protein